MNAYLQAFPHTDQNAGDRVQAASSPFDENHLWLPPRRLALYQIAKTIGGFLMGLTFLGWMLIQWSNIAMRWLAAVLLILTAWIITRTILSERLTQRNHQVSLEADCFRITTPRGITVVPLNAIKQAQWRQGDPDQTGLWFFDHQQQVLARLDHHILPDAEEARRFLGWARQRRRLDFAVLWFDSECQPPTPNTRL